MGQPGAVNHRLSGALRPRLRLALLLSLLGHGLLWWCWPQPRPQARPPAAPTLTLLAYPPATASATQEPSRSAPPQPSPTGATRTTTPSRAPSPETSPSPAHVQTTPSAHLSASSQGQTPAPSLDLGKIYDQARQMAKNASSAAPAGLSGDYYGTYSGGDQGSFYFHLDRNGRITGSGQSNNQGVEFLISGHVDQDGSIQMSGRGLAGAARFNGFIDASHKRVSGTWQLPGFGSGTFSGRHEATAQ